MPRARPDYRCEYKFYARATRESQEHPKRYNLIRSEILLYTEEVLRSGNYVKIISLYDVFQ